MDTAKAGKVRSRLVAQDFNTDKGKVAELCAAIPPLLAARWLCSRAASQGENGMGPLILMTLDFSKAFLYGNVDREVYIELPDEDARKHQSDCVGKLIRSMYGLRDAPQILQRVVGSLLVQMGYKPLLGTQCMYAHPELNIVIAAHVDDFLVLGTEDQLRELIKELQVNYECSGQVLGIHEGCQPELICLGRTITLTPDGIEWEGDKRHVETFLTKLAEEFTDVEDNKKSQWSGAKTPGVKVDVVPERISLDKDKGKAYRGLAALANFMAQDRAVIGFAAKEFSKSISDPAISQFVPLKRLGL